MLNKAFPDLLIHSRFVGMDDHTLVSLGLISVGGQLQFRLPDGGTFECYWVDVDTYKSVDRALPWTVRVNRTAQVALRDFEALQQRFDFVAEGRMGFQPYLDALVAQGRVPADCMCFVWYVLSEDAEKAIKV